MPLSIHHFHHRFCGRAYLGKRHGFVTVVLDLDSKAIVAVVKGRGKMPLREVFALLKAVRPGHPAALPSGGCVAPVNRSRNHDRTLGRFHPLYLSSNSSNFSVCPLSESQGLSAPGVLGLYRSSVT